jgi:urate oxidase
MGIVLGDNRYGKAEVRVVRVARGAETHELTDLNVSIALAGDLADVHLSGDNAHVLPTDSQKNTVYAFARRYGIESPEEFGLRLARHFVSSQPAVERARVTLESFAWQRTGPHSFVRSGQYVREAAVTVVGDDAWVVSGLSGLTVLNTTGSEFWGYVKDEYTTLPETNDRILATVVNASWRHAGMGVNWRESFVDVRDALLAAFAETYSYSLQQTLYQMGRRVLAEQPGIAEIRLSMPNKHHFLVDLEPFGLDNEDEVYVATDRPYGLIEGTVTRDDAPPAGEAW